MLITRLALAARRLTRRSSASAVRNLHTREQLNRIIERERARSDRSGLVFSLILFEVGEAQADLETLTHVARILRRRLRLTDDVGRWDVRRIGAILPDTPATGAWTVADDVCVCVPPGLPLPDCSVYCYPSDWLDRDRGSQRDEDESGARRRPVRAMESLFIRRLPLWKRGLDVAGASLGLLLLAPLLAIWPLQSNSLLPARSSFAKGGADWEARTSGCGNSVPWSPTPKSANGNCCRSTSRTVRRSRSRTIPASPAWAGCSGAPASTNCRNCGTCSAARCRWSVRARCPATRRAACRGWLRRRLEVTPGLTCFWQVQGRSSVTFAEWVRLDVRYIRARSPWADVKLLPQTVPAVFSRRGAS